MKAHPNPLMFNDKKGFLRRYISTMSSSSIENKGSLAITDILLKYDPFDRMDFEVSFKIAKNTLLPGLRFLNIDANLYSCRSTDAFLLRTNLCRNIVANHLRSRNADKVFTALEKVSLTPMDLYFGFDMNNSDYVFAIWLIFGGVKRDGEVQFWPYDLERIARSFLKELGLRMHRVLEKNLLNLGIDISGNKLFYKLYYLLRDKANSSNKFSILRRKIDACLSDFRYFYFYSNMYDKNGTEVKSKLFIEFLEDLPHTSARLPGALDAILDINNSDFKHKHLMEIIKKIGGKVSLVSFEPSDTVTLYIRPIRVT